jgi:hypothetical protein
MIFLSGILRHFGSGIENWFAISRSSSDKVKKSKVTNKRIRFGFIYFQLAKLYHFQFSEVIFSWKTRQNVGSQFPSFFTSAQCKYLIAWNCIILNISNFLCHFEIPLEDFSHLSFEDLACRHITQCVVLFILRI